MSPNEQPVPRQATRSVAAPSAGSASTANALEGVLDSLAAAERPKVKGNRWKWEAGDRLVLRVKEVGEVDGKFGVRTFLKGSVEGDVSSEDGGAPLKAGTTRTVYLDSAALRDWNEAEKPQAGDLVAVLYMGKDDSHDFRCKVVERSEGSPDDIPF